MHRCVFLITICLSLFFFYYKATIFYLQEELLKEEKLKKKRLKDVGGDGDFKIQRSIDDSAIGYGRMGMLDKRTSPRQFTKFGVDSEEDRELDMHRFGRSMKPSALPPLEPMVSHSVDSKLSAFNKKKGKKKKLTDYHMDDDNALDRKSRDSAIDRLGLSLHEPGSWNTTEADVHDLTPRVSKPKKNNKVVRTGKIDEDNAESGTNLYNSLSLQQYGNARMTEKLNRYGEMYPLKSYEKSSLQRNGDLDSTSRWKMEREDSLYRRHLKDIAPPNLKRFDEDDDDDKNIDEGIGDNSENSDEDTMQRYRYTSPRQKNLNLTKYDSRNTTNQRYKTQKKLQDSDDDDLEYSMHSTLKDTMRFPRSPPEGDSVKDYRKELDELRYRKSNDFKSQLREREKNDPSRFGRGDHRFNNNTRRYGNNNDDDEEDEDDYKGRYGSKGKVAQYDNYGRKLRSPVHDDGEYKYSTIIQ